MIKQIIFKFNKDFKIQALTIIIIKKYHAGGIITKRISKLINPEGIIEKAYPTVNPAKHAEEILNVLENLKN